MLKGKNFGRAKVEKLVEGRVYIWQVLCTMLSKEMLDRRNIPALHGWRRSGCYIGLWVFSRGRIGSEAWRGPYSSPEDWGLWNECNAYLVLSPMIKKQRKL